MNKFDFLPLQKKYPLLSNIDISFLNQFFNSDHILSKFKELEKIRKKLLFTELIAIILVNIVFLIINYYFFHKNFSEYKGILGFINIATILIILLFFKNIPKEIKENIIPELASTINSNLKYDSGSKYTFDETIFINNGILNSYDRLDCKEDGIEYKYNYTGDFILEENDKNIELENVVISKVLPENISKSINNLPKGGFIINGYEIQTSKKLQKRDKNGNVQQRYETNNHAYLMRIKFENPVNNVKEGITLKTDKNDNFKRKIVIVTFIYIFVMAFLFGIFVAIFGSNFKEYFDSIGVNVFAPIILICLIMYYLIYILYNKFLNYKRVKLENIEFEKKFDVYCKDQIESRKILTPDFMYKIVDYVNKISNNRIYEFHFIGNEIYIKRDLMSGSISFMEISIFKNLITNIEQLLQFYLEFKSSASLAQDLGLFYFDRTTMVTEIIKK